MYVTPSQLPEPAQPRPAHTRNVCVCVRLVHVDSTIICFLPNRARVHLSRRTRTTTNDGTIRSDLRVHAPKRRLSCCSLAHYVRSVDAARVMFFFTIARDMRTLCWLDWDVG